MISTLDHVGKGRCHCCDRPRVGPDEFRLAWNALIDQQPEMGLRKAHEYMIELFAGRCIAGDVAGCANPGVDWRARSLEAEARLENIRAECKAGRHRTRKHAVSTTDIEFIERHLPPEISPSD